MNLPRTGPSWQSLVAEVAEWGQDLRPTSDPPQRGRRRDLHPPRVGSRGGRESTPQSRPQSWGPAGRLAPSDARPAKGPGAPSVVARVLVVGRNHELSLVAQRVILVPDFGERSSSRGAAKATLFPPPFFRPSNR